MEFRVADTFVDSLAKFQRDEQRAVKTTVFDLQMNPASPCIQFHTRDIGAGSKPPGGRPDDSAM